MIDLDDFIARRVTGRSRSLFADDLAAHDEELRAALEGKSLLVVGGAGTIGGAFVREALRYRPSRLVVVDTSENGLTELTRDLRSTAGQYVPDAYTTYPIDFGSPTFARLFAAEGPFDVVAHFAAHKHVRSEKDRFSIEAMVRNNVLSSVRLLDLVAHSGAERFFCVSTDKAANPANVMGASKKLMEEAVLAYAGEGLVAATTTRFANVAFSHGSLPAGFLERIAKRQPLSAPSDVRRYFVSPEESGQLCLAACALGSPGDIAFPRLGESTMLTFDAIADALLEELGYTPEQYATEDAAREAALRLGPPGLAQGPDGTVRRSLSEAEGRVEGPTWPVHYFVSDTSGEKPAEEFHTAGEPVDLDRFAAIGIVRPDAPMSVAGIRETCAELSNLFERDALGKSEIVEVLRRLVPTFDHVETGRGLDARM
ncbi:MAG TPA: polysaccharide biosynthesis protein [Microbacteriaceae bacterium]|nr:polysaccharide biosynthesis protein [Microbacteriaceae bacterium]